MKPILSFTLAALGGLAATAAFAAPATAADCKSAATASDRAICANPAVAKADADMRAAFDALIAASAPADQKVFQSSQSAWLDDRHTDCDFADATEKPAKPAAAATCVTEESDARRRFLAGEPDAGPGVPGIVPVMRQGQGFIWSLHFSNPATPAEKLVNDKLDGEVAALHIGKIDDKGMYVDPNDYTDDFDAELAYASPALLSVAVTGSHYAPATKDSTPVAYNLNVDMKAGKVLTFADAFAPDALPGLQKQCVAQLGDFVKPEKGDKGEAAANLKLADAAVADLAWWSFGAKAVTINMDPGDEDPYECHLPYAALRKIIKPDFPLPS